MILRKFVSITACLVAISGSFAQSPEAQAGKGKPVPQRYLAVCFLHAQITPELYFKDQNGQPMPLQIGTTRFEPWNLISATETFELYKREIEPNITEIDPVTKKPVLKPGRVKFEPVQRWSLPPGNGNLLKLYYYTGSGKVMDRFLDCSPERHTALKVRILNLTDQTVAVRVGGAQQIATAGNEYFLTPEATLNKPFEFQFGYQRSSGDNFISPITHIRFRRPTERLTILIGHTRQEQTSETGRTTVSYVPNYINFVEDIANLPKPSSPEGQP